MKVDENCTIKSLELIPIKPFKHICIADPYYLEEIDLLKTTKNNTKHLKTLQDLVFDEKAKACNHGMVMIATVNTDCPEENFNFDTTVVDIILTGNTEDIPPLNQLKTYLSGMYYRDTLRKVSNLACDCAEFGIEIDGKYLAFRTGADGYYGYAEKYKDGYGLSIELSLDSDLFTEQDIKRSILYLCERDNKFLNKQELNMFKDVIIKDIKRSGAKIEQPTTDKAIEELDR